MTAAAVLTAGFLLTAWAFVYTCATTQPQPTPAPVAEFARPLMGQPTRLPRRPEGKAALKAEIRLSWVEPPPLRVRPQVPRWTESAEWPFLGNDAAWDDFFAGLPDDQAVMRVGAAT